MIQQGLGAAARWRMPIVACARLSKRMRVGMQAMERAIEKWIVQAPQTGRAVHLSAFQWCTEF
jgi:hypothetical protein